MSRRGQQARTFRSAAAAGMIAAVVGWASLSAGAAAQPAGGPCAAESDAFAAQLSEARSGPRPDAGQSLDRARLRLPEGGQTVSFPFGQGRGQMTRTVTFPVDNDPDDLLVGGEQVQVEPLLLTRDRSTAVFPGVVRVLAAHVTDDGQALRVELCVDAGTAAPGQWVGALVTDDWRFDRTSLAVAVTLKTGHSDWLPWAVAVPTAALALAAQWALVRYESKKHAEVGESAGRPRAVTSIVAGVVLVALAIVVYPHVLAIHQDRSWGGTWDEVWTLGWDVGRTAMTAYPAVATATIVAVVTIASLQRRMRSARPPDRPTRPSTTRPPDDTADGQLIDADRGAP